MDFFNDIFHNLALIEFYFLNIIYILIYTGFILSIFFQHSNILTRASHYWCLASNIVLVFVLTPEIKSPATVLINRNAHGKIIYSTVLSNRYAHGKKYIQAPHYWLFVGRILLTKGYWYGKRLHVMISLSFEPPSDNSVVDKIRSSVQRLLHSHIAQISACIVTKLGIIGIKAKHRNPNPRCFKCQ